MTGDGCGRRRAGWIDRIVVGMDQLADARKGRGGAIDHQAVERRNEQEREHRDDDDGADRQADDPPDHAHDVGRTHPMGSPARLPGPHPEDAVEESPVPGQPDDERLVERITASAAEVANRIVSLAALPADEVAGMPTRGRLHDSRTRPRARHRRRDGGRPSRGRLVQLHRGCGRRRGRSRDSSEHGFGCGDRCRSNR